MQTISGEEFREEAGRRRGLPPALVKELTRLDNAKAIRELAETYGVLALAIGLAAWQMTWWAVLPALVVIASRQQALFVLAHDAAHYRLFKSRLWNDIWGRLSAGLIGYSMATYRVVHRLHHNHLYEPQDPDIPLHGGYPRGRAYLARKLLADVCGLNAWKTYAYFFGAPALNDDVGAENRPLDDTSPALRRTARRDRWVVVALHVALLAAALTGGWLVEYLLLWLLPLVTLLQPLLRLRAICEHGAVRDLSSPLTAARTNLGPRWLIWAMFPHHVNYHIEHHTYPSVPMYNLPACHRAMQAHGLLEGAEVRHLGDTLARVFAPRESAPAAGTA